MVGLGFRVSGLIRVLGLGSFKALLQAQLPTLNVKVFGFEAPKTLNPKP